MKKFPLSISNSPLAIIAVAIISTLLFTACRKDEYETPYMTVTLLKQGVGNVSFQLSGSGEITVNWNDGTPPEIFMFSPEGYINNIRHSYSSPPPHVISITGDNITRLNCFGMYYVTSLDLSRNTKLTSLWLLSNQLTSLDLSRNTALTILNCGSNQLTRLDLSRNTALTYLQCEHNRLTSLDVSRNTALTELNCDINLLTSLDVSKNTKLTSLSCGNNQLTNLDVSKNTALTYLDCGVNNLQVDALNTLFHSLPVVSSGVIRIGSNPGTEACDRSIATTKGWRVSNY